MLFNAGGRTMLSERNKIIQYNHWDYFIALEHDLETISRYIEFNEKNYNTYSIELSHLLLAASSEVDVVLSSLCGLINSKISHNNIHDYQKTIKEYLPELCKEKVTFPRYGLSIEPFRNWESNDDLE